MNTEERLDSSSSDCGLQDLLDDMSLEEPIQSDNYNNSIDNKTTTTTTTKKSTKKTTITTTTTTTTTTTYEYRYTNILVPRKSHNKNRNKVAILKNTRPC